MDKEIPHCMKLTKLVLKAWDLYYVDLKTAFHVSETQFDFLGVDFRLEGFYWEN
jgi:hypothetical protein